MEPVAETPAAAPAPRRPRVWPTLVVLGAALPVVVLVTGASIAAGAALDGVSLRGRGAPRAVEDWIHAAAGEPRLLVWMFLPAQLGFLALALAAALASRQPLRERLGLRRPRASAATLGLCLLGTLGVQLVITFASELVLDELSPQLQLLSKVFLEPTGVWAVVTVLVLSVVPGFCEELFCRGYAQTRLVAAWGGWRAVALTTLFFALMHMDPQHSLFVLPLGAWLGFVAWRTRSTWTAVACHALNNAVAILHARWADAHGIETGALLPAYALLGAVLLAFTALAVRRLLRAEPGDAEEPAPEPVRTGGEPGS